jgi:ABC-type branched-subunit amino acid transport system permease subunit
VLALRSERLLRNERGLQPVLWVALLLGAAITVGFTYLLGVENFRFQLVATALLSLLIGLMFALIIALNYPFRGAVHVSREPWDTFYHTLTGKSVSCEAPRPRQ